jgi:hypothetical protein
MLAQKIDQTFAGFVTDTAGHGERCDEKWKAEYDNPQQSETEGYAGDGGRDNKRGIDVGGASDDAGSEPAEPG